LENRHGLIFRKILGERDKEYLNKGPLFYQEKQSYQLTEKGGLGEKKGSSSSEGERYNPYGLSKCPISKKRSDIEVHSRKRQKNSFFPEKKGGGRSEGKGPTHKASPRVTENLPRKIGRWVRKGPPNLLVSDQKSYHQPMGKGAFFKRIEKVGNALPLSWGERLLFAV